MALPRASRSDRKGDHPEIWFSGTVHSQVPIWGSVLLHLVRLGFSSRAQCITIAVTQFSGMISEHKTHFLRLIKADAYFPLSNVVPQFVS